MILVLKKIALKIKVCSLKYQQHFLCITQIHQMASERRKNHMHLFIKIELFFINSINKKYITSDPYTESAKNHHIVERSHLTC